MHVCYLGTPSPYIPFVRQSDWRSHRASNWCRPPSKQNNTPKLTYVWLDGYATPAHIARVAVFRVIIARVAIAIVTVTRVAITRVVVTRVTVKVLSIQAV